MASVMWHCGVREPIMFYIVNTHQLGRTCRFSKIEWNIQDKNLLWLIRKYLKAGIMEQGKFEPTKEGSAQANRTLSVLWHPMCYAGVL